MHTTKNPTLEITKEFGIGDGENILKLLYAPDHCRLFASTSSGVIIVFCMKTYEKLETLRPHSDVVQDMILLTDDIFLSCSWDTRIFAFCIKELRILKFFLQSSSCVICLMKIPNNVFSDESGEEYFLLANTKNEVLIVGYNEDKVVKTIDPSLTPKVSFSDEIIMSRVHDNCFFYSSPKIGIRLINYQKDTLVRKFKFKFVISSMKTMLRGGDEYLIISEKNKNQVHVVDSCKTNQWIIETLNNSISCSYCLSGFLVLGCSEGEFECYGNFIDNRYYLNKNLKKNWSISHQIFEDEDMITSIELLTINNLRKKVVSFAFSAGGGIRFVQFTDLQIDEMYELELRDIKDRTRFLSLEYIPQLKEEEEEEEEEEKEEDFKIQRSQTDRSLVHILLFGQQISMFRTLV